MNEVLKTMLIKGENGPVRINETDFDEEKHTRYSAKAANEENDKAVDTVNTTRSVPEGAKVPVAPSAPNFERGDGTPPPAPENPSPNQLLVSKQGTKHIVVDMNGAPVEREGIEPKGYKTEKEAWDAVFAVQSGTPSAVHPATLENPQNNG